MISGTIWDLPSIQLKSNPRHSYNLWHHKCAPLIFESNWLAPLFARNLIQAAWISKIVLVVEQFVHTIRTTLDRWAASLPEATTSITTTTTTDDNWQPEWNTCERRELYWPVGQLQLQDKLHWQKWLLCRPFYFLLVERLQTHFVLARMYSECIHKSSSININAWKKSLPTICVTQLADCSLSW